MKTTMTKKFFNFILLFSGMFSFTPADAQCYCSCDSHPRFNAYCVTKPNGTFRCKSVGHSACERIGNSTTSLNVSSLEDIYPNPVSATATVLFYVAQTENVSVKIFDMSGRMVAVLADASFEEGDHEINWNAAVVNAGIYFLQFESAENFQTQKIVVTK